MQYAQKKKRKFNRLTKSKILAKSIAFFCALCYLIAIRLLETLPISLPEPVYSMTRIDKAWEQAGATSFCMEGMQEKNWGLGGRFIGSINRRVHMHGRRIL